MSVAGFRDYARNGWGNSGDWVYRIRGDLTGSRSSFLSALNSLTAYNGGDTREAHLPALSYLLLSSSSCIDSNGDGDCTDPFDTPSGLQPSFRSGARKVILLATDAGFHTPQNTSGYPGPSRDAVVSSLLARFWCETTGFGR